MNAKEQLPLGTWRGYTLYFVRAKAAQISNSSYYAVVYAVGHGKSEWRYVGAVREYSGARFKEAVLRAKIAGYIQ